MFVKHYERIQSVLGDILYLQILRDNYNVVVFNHMTALRDHDNTKEKKQEKARKTKVNDILCMHGLGCPNYSPLVSRG